MRGISFYVDNQVYEILEGIAVKHETSVSRIGALALLEFLNRELGAGWMKKNNVNPECFRQRRPNHRKIQPEQKPEIVNQYLNLKHTQREKGGEKMKRPIAIFTAGWLIGVLSLALLFLVSVTAGYAADYFQTAAKPLVINTVLLSAIAGFGLSVLFEWIPRAKAWYDQQGAKREAQLMLLFIVAVSLVIFALGCTNLVVITIQCNQMGLWELLAIAFATGVTNQSTFLLLVQPFQPKT